ncbi:hypothetical protein Tcan_09737 [Toxocara canis]|uniref:Uncharacterized protein n=1 Tax=Toxocara canis TaxID=6265 RepID=A0A0B2VA93_TOXCA|nr:hypothetical protein Tcan_09737 [Toxocara canis]
MAMRSRDYIGECFCPVAEEDSLDDCSQQIDMSEAAYCCSSCDFITSLFCGRRGLSG